MKLGKFSKTLFGIAGISLFSLPLLAGSHSLKAISRFDHNYTMPSFGDSTKNFTVNRIQLDFKGPLPVEGMTYRIRPRISKYPLAAAGSAGVNSDIDYMYVVKDFGNNLSVKAGKIFVKTGGWENDYGGEDQYSGSLTGGQFRGYGNGVDLTYKFMNQSVGFQVLNSATSEASGGTSGKRYAKGLYWYGNLMDGMIKPMVTYHLDPSMGVGTGVNNAEVYSKDLSIGVQLNVSKMKFEVDYLTLNKEGQAGTFAQPADDEYTSIVAQLHYTCGNWTPYFKYSIDERTSKSTSLLDIKLESTVLDAGVEYSLAKGHRLHLVYSMTDNDYDNNWVTTTSTTTEEDGRTSTIRLGYKIAVGIF